ncbi:DUF3796 domain-containing protein [Clostridiaceae bacterium M8S5]|nr:DUF3796 domain-containing protein [Clostridiaceae bacterium M8S5]
MKVKQFNPLALLGLLSLLGLVGIIKDEPLWYSWFGWFVWFKYLNHPIDERFKNNINKASRNGFIVAVVGIMTIIFMKGIHIAENIVNGIMAIAFIAMMLIFVVSFLYFEKLGD